MDPQVRTQPRTAEQIGEDTAACEEDLERGALRLAGRGRGTRRGRHWKLGGSRKSSPLAC